MKALGPILIIDEKSKKAKVLVQWLHELGCEKVDISSNGYSGLEYLGYETYKLVFVSTTLPLLKMEELIPKILKLQPALKIVLIGPFLEEPLTAHIENAVSVHLEDIDNRKELEKLLRKWEEKELRTLSVKIIGATPVMKEYFAYLGKIQKSSVTVLIFGESGTGKELTARALHEGGARSEKPFVTVNCAAIPETLMESELFGHERGAFTGAVEKRIGRFEMADEGTIFFDEVAELSPVIQSKLLRILEEQSFERVGGNETVHVDVRIISATNKDLKKLVRKGLFREDLYYRLNAISIYVPPLRNRKEDIPRLIYYFLEKYLIKTGKTGAMTVDDKALELLKKQDWPGNVRELENVIMRAMVQSEDSVIGVEDLSFTDEKNQDEKSFNRPMEDFIVDKMMGVETLYEGQLINRLSSWDELEREAIEKALIESDFNVSKAAGILNIGRMTFYRKMKLYAIKAKNLYAIKTRKQT